LSALVPIAFFLYLSLHTFRKHLALTIKSEIAMQNRPLSASCEKLKNGYYTPILLLLSLLFTSACSDNDSEAIYETSITRTQYGIPHIKAYDWGSLGYGYGYAYAEDNFCVLMKEIVRANGETARYFGDDGDLHADIVYRYYGRQALIDSVWIQGQPANLIDLTKGYVAGFNRYLDETGAASLAEGPEGCRNAPWVRQITPGDLYRVLAKLVLRASTTVFTDAISAIDAPATISPLRSRPDPQTLPSPAAERELLKQLKGLPLPRAEESGSNAYAFGREITENGRGMLLGNPHFPWHGPERFYMAHLTLPGVYDVMGASLHGLPLINIGFNKDIAWTHTVSTGSRFTVYELELNPDNPMQYRYEGEWRDISSELVTVQIEENGQIIEQQHTLYFSHYGPLLDLGQLDPLLVTFGFSGWPTPRGSVFSLRDANLNNNRGLIQWQKIGQAKSIDELQTALTHIGIPWVNTIAVDQQGNAFYGDITSIPNLSQTQIDDCSLPGVVSTFLRSNEGLTLLDGSRASCEWGSDSDAPIPGIFGYQSLPKLVNTSFVANANDSYWLSNPDQLLSGFPDIIGKEEVTQTLRTRLTFLQVEERLAGSDGLAGNRFTLDNLQSIMFSNRNLAAELVGDEIVSLCQMETDWTQFGADTDLVASVQQACTILANWDGKNELSSVGTHIFSELWNELDDRLDAPFASPDWSDFWANPFDPADPVHSPTELAESPSIHKLIKESLVEAVSTLTSANIPLDSSWGELQYRLVNDERIAIHGGRSAFSFSVISSKLTAGEGYSNITHGNSYMQTVSWDQSNCPDAFALLSYSQSTNPASAHYADQTRLYAQKRWVDMPFCPDAIDASTISSMVLRGK
jgi:acyl-homoserine-lactone acylase